MKKVTSIILAILIVLSCFALSSCSKPSLKLGLGITSTFDKALNADGETKGSVAIENTAAAVLLDANGKIVKCVIDAVGAKAEFTSKGELAPANEFKTKNELGKNYGMSAIGKTEWNEQVAAFCKQAEGKTLDEVKALVTTEGKGNADVIAAGCTIYVGGFITVIEKAIANATESNATDKDNLVIGFSTVMEKGSNASDDKDGSCDIVSDICAVAIDKDSKVTASTLDSVVNTISFNQKGENTTNKQNVLLTKREIGENYGMAAYGKDLNGDGVVKEWFEQANAFDAACIGKTKDEISALAVGGYGVESVQTAGCTIAIANMVKAYTNAIK